MSQKIEKHYTKIKITLTKVLATKIQNVVAKIYGFFVLLVVAPLTQFIAKVLNKNMRALSLVLENQLSICHDVLCLSYNIPIMEKI